MLTTHFLALLEQTGLVARVVLLVLLGFSLYGWSLGIYKLLEVRAARRKLEKFIAYSRGQGEIKQVYETAKTIGGLGGKLFIVSFSQASKLKKGHYANPQTIERSAQGFIRRELGFLEQRVSALASIGAVSPYVGLLGTVWGIMSAFAGLSDSSRTTLAQVAPGIAEALIATAVGLLVAIPAVLAYNRLVSELDAMESQLQVLASEFVNLFESQLA